LTASSRCWTWWRPHAATSSRNLRAFLPASLDLDQLVFLRRLRLEPLATRAAERLAVLHRGRLRGRLAAIGLDHHQARIVEELLRVDVRLFHLRLLTALLRAGLLGRRLVARLLGLTLLLALRLLMRRLLGT